MREYKKEKKVIEELILEKILCNKCGMDSNNRDEEELIVGIKEMKLDFGYEYSLDGQSWSFDLCEKCFIEWVKTLKYAPKGFKKRAGYNAEEVTQEEFENWKMRV